MIHINPEFRSENDNKPELPKPWETEMPVIEQEESQIPEHDLDQAWGEKICKRLTNLLDGLNNVDFLGEDGQVVFKIGIAGDSIFTLHDMTDDSIYYVNYLGDPVKNSFEESGADKKSLQKKIEQIIALIPTLKKNKATSVEGLSC